MSVSACAKGAIRICLPSGHLVESDVVPPIGTVIEIGKEWSSESGERIVEVTGHEWSIRTVESDNGLPVPLLDIFISTEAKLYNY